MQDLVKLTEEVVTLRKENEDLKKQNVQNQQGIQGLMAQFDASKQMLNESLVSSLNVRTQLVYCQNQIKDANVQLEARQKKVDELSKNIADLNKELSNHIVRIKELEDEKKSKSPVNESAPVDLKSAKAR